MPRKIHPVRVVDLVEATDGRYSVQCDRGDGWYTALTVSSPAAAGQTLVIGRIPDSIG